MRILRIWISMLAMVFLPSCIISVEDFSDDELSKMINLRVYAAGSNEVSLTFNSGKGIEFILLRSKSLHDLQEQTALRSELYAYYSESIKCIKEKATPIEVDRGELTNCLNAYNNHPEDLINDVTYFYVLRASFSDKYNNVKIFYSNIVAATPKPNQNTKVQSLNAAFPSNKVGGIYGEEIKLYFSRKTIDASSGLLEYDIYYSNVDSSAACDYYNLSTCPFSINPTTTIDLQNGFVPDQINQHYISSDKPQFYTHNLKSDKILQKNHLLSGRATLSSVLPIYYKLDVVNSHGNSNTAEYGVTRFPVEIKTLQKGGGVVITAKNIPHLSVKTPIKNGVITSSSKVPNTYRIFYSHSATNIDEFNTGILSPNNFPVIGKVIGLSNGTKYYFKVVADYYKPQYDLGTIVSRISNIVVATPVVDPATPVVEVGYTDFKEEFFLDTSSTPTAWTTWYPDLNAARYKSFDTDYYITRDETTEFSYQITSNNATKIYNISRDATNITSFEIYAVTSTPASASTEATINRFRMLKKEYSKIRIKWKPQLEFASFPSSLNIKKTSYSVYITDEATHDVDLQNPASAFTIDSTGSLVASGITNTLSYVIAKKSNGVTLTVPGSYVVKIVATNDSTANGAVMYAVSEVKRVYTKPVPPLRDLYLYFRDQLDTSVVVVAASPVLDTSETYYLYESDIAILDDVCDLMEIADVNNCGGTTLYSTKVFTMPATFNLFPVVPRWFTLLATNTYGPITSFSSEIDYFPMTAGSSLETPSRVDIYWDEQFGNNESNEDYIIYYKVAGTQTYLSTMVHNATSVTIFPPTTLETYSFVVVASNTIPIFSSPAGFNPVYLRSTTAEVYITTKATDPIITGSTITSFGLGANKKVFGEVYWDLKYLVGNSPKTKVGLVCAASPMVSCNYAKQFLGLTTSPTCTIRDGYLKDITPSPVSLATNIGTSTVILPFGEPNYCSVVKYVEGLEASSMLISNEATFFTPPYTPYVTGVAYSNSPSNTVADVSWNSSPSVDTSYILYYYKNPRSGGSCVFAPNKDPVGCAVIASQLVSYGQTFTHPATYEDIFYTIVASNSLYTIPSTEDKILISISQSSTTGPDYIKIDMPLGKHGPDVEKHTLCIRNTPLQPSINCNLYSVATPETAINGCSSIVDPYNPGNKVVSPDITVGSTMYIYPFAVHSGDSRATPRGGKTCGKVIELVAGVPESPYLTGEPGQYQLYVNWDEVEPQASNQASVDYTIYRWNGNKCGKIDPSGNSTADATGFITKPYVRSPTPSFTDDVLDAFLVDTVPATFCYKVRAKNLAGYTDSNELVMETKLIDTPEIGKEVSGDTFFPYLATYNPSYTYSLYEYDFDCDASNFDRRWDKVMSITGCVNTLAASPFISTYGSVINSASVTINPSLLAKIFVTVNNGRETVAFGPMTLSDSTDPEKIDIGDQFGCAITSGRELYCWGKNDIGQLGIGKISAFSKTASKVIDENDIALHDIIKLSSGVYHSCAIQDDSVGGKVYCWGGENAWGEIGTGAQKNTGMSPDSYSAANGGIYKAFIINGTNGVLAGKAVESISAGNRLTCAILKSSTGSATTKDVECWGSNREFGLGRGDRDNHDITGNYPIGYSLAAQRVNIDQMIPPGMIFTPTQVSISDERAADVNKVCVLGGINMPTTPASNSDVIFCWGANASDISRIGYGADNVQIRNRGISTGYPTVVSGLTGKLPTKELAPLYTTPSLRFRNGRPAGWPEIIIEMDQYVAVKEHFITGNFATPGVFMSTSKTFSCSILVNNKQTPMRTWNESFFTLNTSSRTSQVITHTNPDGGQIRHFFVDQYPVATGRSVKCWGYDHQKDGDLVYFGRLGRGGEVGAPTTPVNTPREYPRELSVLMTYKGLPVTDPVLFTKDSTAIFQFTNNSSRILNIKESDTCSGSSPNIDTYRGHYYGNNNIFDLSWMGRCTVGGIGPQSNEDRVVMNKYDVGAKIDGVVYRNEDTGNSIQGQTLRRPRMKIFAGEPTKVVTAKEHACALLQSTDSFGKYVGRGVCWGTNKRYLHNISNFFDRHTTLINEVDYEHIPELASTITVNKYTDSVITFPYVLSSDYFEEDPVTGDTTGNRGTKYNILDIDTSTYTTCFIAIQQGRKLVHCRGEGYVSNMSATTDSTIFFD